MASILEIERQIEQLPIVEQRQIAEWLTDRLKHSAPLSFGPAMAAMAADPNIQAELKKIDNEFGTTESDGLVE